MEKESEKIEPVGQIGKISGSVQEISKLKPPKPDSKS